MDLYRIREDDFLELLDNLSSRGELFVPTGTEEDQSFSKWGELSTPSIPFPKTRLDTPAKAFFSPPKEEVASFPADDSTPTGGEQAVFGLKACDLASLKVLDEIFLGGEIIDPYYAARRKETLLISSDCYEVSDTCFCNKVGGQPYPEKGFDLNVTKLPGSDDLLIEVNRNSPKGKAVYRENSQLFEPASESLVEERDSARTAREKELAEINDFFEIPEEIGEVPSDHPVWREYAEDCVECGACTIGCPTCHCFLLYESGEDSTSTRRKIWDSCSFKGYSRVAGGANPLEDLESRVRNRFYDKFDRIYENHGFYGCTGCGRCIEGCMGEVDMRDVLKEVSVESKI